jgi:hypothetical protein
MHHGNCDLVRLTMKNTTILLIGVSAIALVGCTNSFSKVRGAMKDAPEWYEQRRKEVRGEGYPKLADVPVIDEASKPGKSLPATAERVETLTREFAAAEALLTAPSPPAELEALVDRIQGEFVGVSAPGNFFTEAEVAALQAQFDVPRVTEGMKAPQ